MSCGFEQEKTPAETEVGPSCGFKLEKTPEVGPQMEPDPEPEVEAEVEPPTVNIEAEWNEVTRHLSSPCTFEEFTLTDDDIVASLNNDEDAPSDKDHEEEEPVDVTLKKQKLQYVLYVCF
jgi:hypothetical protein